MSFTCDKAFNLFVRVRFKVYLEYHLIWMNLISFLFLILVLVYCVIVALSKALCRGYLNLVLLGESTA